MRERDREEEREGEGERGCGGRDGSMRMRRWWVGGKVAFQQPLIGAPNLDTLEESGASVGVCAGWRRVSCSAEVRADAEARWECCAAKQGERSSMKWP